MTPEAPALSNLWIQCLRILSLSYDKSALFSVPLVITRSELQYSLLGVHRLSLFWANGEKITVKRPGILIQKIGMLNVRALSSTN